VGDAPFSPIVRNALARLRACAERSTLGGDVRVVLFGSYAHGQADEHSDIDVLVVIPVESASARTAVIDEAALLYAETGVLVQPIVLTADEHARRLEGGHPLLRAIAAEGIAA
jgi:predicted nucleotidyltransferase